MVDVSVRSMGRTGVKRYGKIVQSGRTIRRFLTQDLLGSKDRIFSEI